MRASAPNGPLSDSYFGAKFLEGVRAIEVAKRDAGETTQGFIGGTRMALEHEAKQSFGRSSFQSVTEVRETLEEAQDLAVQIERLLSNPRCNFAEADAFRVRLARAHTLSLLDQLSDMLGPEVSAPRSALREDDDNHVASGIRPAWR
jgi:hypothetical protein